MTTIEFDDFDHLSSFFTNWEGSFEQLSRGRFAGTIRAVQGQVARVVSLTASQTFLARGVGDPACLTLIPITSGNVGALWQRRELIPGHLVVQGPNAETDHRSARGYEVLMLSLATEKFFDAARALLASDQEWCSGGWEARLPSPQAVGRLTQSIHKVLECPYQSGSFEAIQYEDRCIRAAVLAMTTGSDRLRCELPLSARTNVARRAEDLLRGSLAEPLGCAAICAELGVSDRTLRLAFKERFGMGPMAFYKQIRLNAARKVLKSEEHTSIRAVARRFGFHHFSNFAGEYRRAFGELPTQARSRC